MSKSRTREPTNESARITDQFHHGSGFVYELNCDGVAVSISIATGGATDWEAEATAKVLPAPVVATGTGRTREEAFSVLREAWCAQPNGVPFPRFDWEAIRQALTAVRAI